MVSMRLEDHQLLAFEWSMIAATACLVLLRLYHRNLRASLSFFEDGFVVLAWLCFVSQVAMDTVLSDMGFFDEQLDVLASDINPEVDDVGSLKIFYVENATYYFCMYAVKAAMLCFYSRLIPRRMKKTRIALWITIVTVVVGFIISTLLNLLLCLPISENWNPSSNCSSGWTSVAGSIVSYIFHLLTDLMIYVLPFSVLRVLPLPTSQKVGVGITFALGFLCIFFAVTVIVVGYISPSVTVNWIVAVFEQTWCVCVACAPALKGLTTNCDFKKWKARISFYREREKDNDSEAGTTTGTMNGSRPPSDATIYDQDGIQGHHLDKGSKRIESLIGLPTCNESEKQHYSRKAEAQQSLPKITPIAPYIAHGPDTEYNQTNHSPSSPGYTMSIASIVDFYDLERQLQLDDEKRQTTSCSPVQERRSSELHYNHSLSYNPVHHMEGCPEERR